MTLLKTEYKEELVEDIKKAVRVYHRNMHGKFVPKTVAGVPKQHTKPPAEEQPGEGE